MSILQIAQQLLAYISVLLGQVGAIYQAIVGQQIVITIHDTAAEVSQTLATVTDPTYGNAALRGQIDAIRAEVDTILADVVALGSPQQAGDPVTLPVTPPAGYGGASTSAIANAVWSQPNVSGYAMGDTMRSLVYFFDGINSQLAWPSPSGGPFRITANIGAFNPEPWLYNPDYGLDSILTTDATVGDWLNRVAARGETWTLDTDSLYWRTFGLGNPANNTTWYCTLSEVEFAEIKALIAGSSVLVPPIWPGLAGVTLGAPVTMTPPGDNITVDCDGVIIAVTGTPSWAGSFSFGTAISYRNVGAVTFTDDNGQQEFAQTFGWTSGVYCPKTMAHASGFAYRAAVGVSGTLTPFVIN